MTVGLLPDVVRQQDRHRQSRRDAAPTTPRTASRRRATRGCRAAADTRSAASTTSTRASAGQVDNLVDPRAHGHPDRGVQRHRHRHAAGASAAAGWSTAASRFGRTEYNNCDVPDVPAQFCHYYMPWEGRPSTSSRCAYPLPYGFQFAARTRGRLVCRRRRRARTRTPRSQPSLGRPLTNTTRAGRPRSSSRTSQFEDRYNQFDLRFSRAHQFRHACG